MLFVISPCPFGIKRNGLSILLLKRRWSLLGWKVTSYLQLYNKTPKIWWLKTMKYCFSWCFKGWLGKSSAPCGVSGVSHAAALNWGFGWVGTCIQEGLVFLHMASHSIWCLILQYSLHMLSLFHIPAKASYVTAGSQECSCLTFLRL